MPSRRHLAARQGSGRRKSGVGWLMWCNLILSSLVLGLAGAAAYVHFATDEDVPTALARLLGNEPPPAADDGDETVAANPDRRDRAATHPPARSGRPDPRTAAPPQPRERTTNASDEDTGPPATFFDIPIEYDNDRVIEPEDDASSEEFAGRLAAIRQAAEQGDPEGQYALGRLYEAGHGVEQDLPEAVRWFSAASDQNHPPAQFALGLMYESGRGVEADFPSAYAWYAIAAQHGHADAGEILQETRYRLRDDELARGRTIADRWLRARGSELESDDVLLRLAGVGGWEPGWRGELPENLAPDVHIEPAHLRSVAAREVIASAGTLIRNFRCRRCDGSATTTQRRQVGTRRQANLSVPIYEDVEIDCTSCDGSGLNALPAISRHGGRLAAHLAQLAPDDSNYDEAAARVAHTLAELSTRRGPLNDLEFLAADLLDAARRDPQQHEGAPIFAVGRITAIRTGENRAPSLFLVNVDGETALLADLRLADEVDGIDRTILFGGVITGLADSIPVVQNGFAIAW